MQINKAGLDLIKKHEGLRLKAYICPAGVLTIGYGHTGKDVFRGQRITEAEAERLLRADIAQFEDGVSELVNLPLTGNQFSALVSLAYNIGLGNFRGSTLLKHVNAGRFGPATLGFAAWKYGGGKVLPGLVNRRRDEADLFALR